jgi:hypothetical protein
VARVPQVLRQTARREAICRIQQRRKILNKGLPYPGGGV